MNRELDSDPRGEANVSAGPDSELLRREEQKREAAWNPLQRWRALQQFITWAESQATGGRNTPARCKEKERAILANLKGTVPFSACPGGQADKNRDSPPEQLPEERRP
ncbi:MAG: hypothetical protein ABSF26_05010 [Thermoguttaceae bacterium]|jgi:hypothetical protein